MADIKLKNYLGESKEYTGVPKIWLQSADSTDDDPLLLPFSYGEAVSAEVEPDFSAGDMAVEIADGQLISELTVKKPAALVPANIAEGVVIAGIIGEMTGGNESGGISTQMISSGTVKLAGTQIIKTGTPGTYSSASLTWTENADGNWKTTVTGVPISTDKVYAYDCHGTGTATPMEYSNLGNYGECILLGSKMLVEGGDQYGLNIGAAFAMIYRPGLGTTTIIIDKTSMTIPYSDGTIDRAGGLELWEYDGGQTISFVHGRTTKPDVVFLSLRNYTADSQALIFGDFVTSAWGLKSALSAASPDGIVGCRVAGSRASKTTEYALDVESDDNDRKFYPYCPDDATVEVYGAFPPGAEIQWFAIWGISAESE